MADARVDARPDAGSTPAPGNPAASRRRMWQALGMIALLAIIAWFTLDGDAALPVREYSIGAFSVGGFSLPVRWLPEVVLGLFAFRVVIANMRARLEDQHRR